MEDLTMSLILRNSVWPSLLDEYLGTSKPKNGIVTNRWYSQPGVNVIESDDKYILELALPGLSKEDIKIDVNNDELVIKSVENEKAEVKRSYLRKEFNYGVFEKTFVLPDSVNTEKVSATMKNGILSVELVKRDEAKTRPPREIKVS